MTTQLRDTYFGCLVRKFAGETVFRYPDEVDPSLWKQSLQCQPGAASASERTEIPETCPEKASGQDCRQSNNSTTPAEAVACFNPRETIDDTGRIHHLVDWYTPEDVENPRNWPGRWKVLVASQICLLNFSVYMGSSIYVPGEKYIIQEFGVNETIATLGLSFFTLGYGTGSMLWSPMSEMPKVGRSSIYFWTLIAFVLLQLPTGYATNMPMFVIFRFLTGFFGSPCISTGGATITDMFEPAQAAYWICIWGAFGICGPVFGPIIGGYIVPVRGWRWTIWILTWLCSLVVVIFFFFMPETSAANILSRRAHRLRQATGDEKLMSQSDLDAQKLTTKDRLLVLSTAFTLTFSEPIAFVLDLYTALLYGLLFIWFESFPLVFGGIYRFDSGQQGLAFLGIFVGALITVPLYLLWLKYATTPKITTPTFKPEMVLPPTFYGALSLPVCLFWYGWSARDNVNWIVPIIGTAFFSISIVTLFNPVLNYLGMVYPQYAASVFAGNSLFRASFGAIFPLFARQLFRKLGIGPGNSLLGGIAICFIPITYCFYKYGERIRRISKKARQDD